MAKNDDLEKAQAQSEHDRVQLALIWPRVRAATARARRAAAASENEVHQNHLAETIHNALATRHGRSRP